MPGLSPGSPVVVWRLVGASGTPRDPRESTVDHVDRHGFTVAGVDAVFRRDGRSRPARGAGAFAPQWRAVAADTDEGRQALAKARRGDAVDDAARAVQAWLAERSEFNRRRAVEALQAIEEEP